MKTHAHTRNYYLPILLLCLLIIALMMYREFKPVTETVKSEVKSIPTEIHVTTPVASPVRVPILMYHYVEYVKDPKDTIRQTLDVVPRIFEEQVKTLQKAGYTFMTASELADVLDGKRQIPEKPVLLTFDDGHWDLYTDVLPILKKYNVKATAYIISGFIGGSDFMTKQQLLAVIESGLVEVGAHTVHHISLAKKLHPVVQFEVNRSRLSLEQEYHIAVVSFAYPNGSFDQQAIDIVQKAGFRTAVSTIPGIEQSQSDRYFLYRLRPGGRTGDTLLRYLEQTTFRPW